MFTCILRDTCPARRETGICCPSEPISSSRSFPKAGRMWFARWDFAAACLMAFIAKALRTPSARRIPSTWLCVRCNTPDRHRGEKELKFTSRKFLRWVFLNRSDGTGASDSADVSVRQYDALTPAHYHRPTLRTSGVDIFAEANEFDAQMIEFVQDFEEMPHRSGHPIECPNEHPIEFVAPGISRQLISTLRVQGLAWRAIASNLKVSERTVSEPPECMAKTSSGLLPFAQECASSAVASGHSINRGRVRKRRTGKLKLIAVFVPLL